MKPRTMTIIIGITLLVLVVFVYKFSVPPKGDKIGPPGKDTAHITIDSVSHTVTVDK